VPVNTVRVNQAHRLADADGRFAMVALDHRESLRGMMNTAPDETTVPDERLRAFKRAGVEVLAPAATAVLLDRRFGLRADGYSGMPASTALILAADRYDQAPGGPVRSVMLDEEITPELVRASGAAALKLLVHWRPDGQVERRAELLERFLDLNRRCGTASVVEGVVRPVEGQQWSSPAERNRSAVAAATELCAVNPDLYKTEVPGYVPGDLSAVRQWSAEVTKVAQRPWVVLSSGVRTAEFPAALRLACAGGAAGFLAGRAVWADAVTAAEPATAFRDDSLPRLRSLTEIANGAVASNR
jgi:sulfofructosephosphate aldolase